MKISRYWKAVAAAVVAGAGSLATALNDDVITAAEAWTTATAVLVALGFTWAVPNKQDEPKEPTA
jgi:hypothetical protein